MLEQNGEHAPSPRNGNIMSADSCQTIDELLRTQAAFRPDEPVVFYPSSGIEYVGYSTRQLDAYAFRVARQYISSLTARKLSSEEPIIVGLLGLSDLDYIITLLALTKLGHTVLLLSPRLTKPAYLRLFDDTGAKYVVYQSPFKEKISNIPGVASIPVIQQALYGQPIDQYRDTNLTPAFDMEMESRKTAWIFHSSGSTGFPKPIFLSQRAVLANYRRNIQKLSMRCFLTLPLFHTFGITSLFRAIISVKPVHIYNVTLPLTKEYLIQSLESHSFELFAVVPYALKVLSESNKGIELLKKLKLVLFGGSPCPDVLGDMLVNNGVNLVSIYGMGETGPLMMSIRPKDDRYWNYLRPTIEAEPFLSFEAREEGFYELVCLNGLPSIATSNREDGSFVTKDLFIKHPMLNAWKYCGRSDDVIVLENGEKVNPTDFEGAVQQHQLVAAAVVFGIGRPYPGMLIVPSTTSSNLSQNELIDQLWPMIERAQLMTPEYAKISKEMVIILPQGTIYPKTDKHTIIRKAFYNQFSTEIDKFYNNDSFEGATTSLTEAELQSLILSETKDLLSPIQVTEDLDFFGLGMDSLKANRLRTFLVKKMNLSGKSLGFNIVFDHPSVLTGATGSLGAHLLATLVWSVNVKKVYCLVRASSNIEARNRVIRSLHTRKLYQNLPFSSRQKMICISSNLSLQSLGLQPELFNQICSELTILYHCAWTVNFNLRLSSFEHDCIVGVKNLLDLCLQAHGEGPAKFSFFSSIGAVLRTQDKIVLEALPTHFSNAQPTGYGQSKLVAEHMCMNAAAQVGIPVYILRIGQIIGDTLHGIWNSSEAIPLMIQTAKTISTLPSIDEDLRWTPVDVVAQSAIEITNSSAAAGIFNLVNPHTVHWTRDILPYLRQAGLEFNVCDPSSWLELLQASEDIARNPPLKLLQYFKNQFDPSASRCVVKFETEKSQRWSKTFSNVQAPDQTLVVKMIRHFTSTNWNVIPQISPLRSIVAFAGSMLIPFGNSEFSAVNLVTSLVSMHLGVPVLHPNAVGFDNGINGALSLKEESKSEASMHLNISGTSPHSGPAITV
ncbi:hypothetical protein B7463_g8837, partial [Scytalidium lignicola]